MIDILIIIITFPYSTCINSFLGTVSSLFLCSFLNVFLYLLYFGQSASRYLSRIYFILQLSRYCWLPFVHDLLCHT